MTTQHHIRQVPTIPNSRQAAKRTEGCIVLHRKTLSWFLSSLFIVLHHLLRTLLIFVGFGLIVCQIIIMIQMRNCNSVVAVMACLLLVTISPKYVSSFQLHRPAATLSTKTISSRSTYLTSSTLLHASENPDKEEEIVGESYEGSVDWDAEWKKVVEDRDQPAQRPGNYKSQAEIGAIKATNKVAKVSVIHGHMLGLCLRPSCLQYRLRYSLSLSYPLSGHKTQ